MRIIPENEEDRLRELKRLGVLDTAAEQCYDEITRQAAVLCKVPIALISLIDKDRQWFKSKVGLEAEETSRDISFCAHAILQATAMVIEDATQDPRFQSNPAVTGDPFVRFYAGIPLITLGGYAMGTLCVADAVPRRLTAVQLDQLKLLANDVIYMLELRALH